MNRNQRHSSPVNKIRKVDPSKPGRGPVAEAAALMKKGGVVIFPTKCLYGLGADALSPEAVEKVFRIKERPPEKPLLVLIGKREELPRIVAEVPATAVAVMDRFWPGNITLVFKAKKILPHALTAGTGKIGVRLPLTPTAIALVREMGSPVTGTSANISDRPGCSRMDDMDEVLVERVDLVLDAGPLKGGMGSTIIDVTMEPPVVIREGEVSAKEIFAFLGLA